MFDFIPRKLVMGNRNISNKIIPFEPDFLRPELSESILNQLPSINNNKRIKLRIRPVPTKKYPNKQSVYIDIFRSGKRDRRYLKLYLNLGSNTKRQDKETLKIAQETRDYWENQLYTDETGFKLPSKQSKAKFLPCFKEITDTKTGGTYKPYINTYKKLIKFTDKYYGGDVSFSRINKQFCLKFKDYLLEEVGQNTAHNYYSKLKVVLNLVIEKGYISENPARGIVIEKENSKKEFLTIKELRALNETECPDEQTKRAFLFTCFTGLRFSDVAALTFDEIQEGYLHFRQLKTNELDHLKLSKDALKIINLQKEEIGTEGKVFDLYGHDWTLKQIKKWVTAAEIKKKIGWHSGRHSFATMALSHGADLYTVSKLLGHKEIRSTQVYAKLVDKTKDRAIDKLPEL
jgi:integrase